MLNSPSFPDIEDIRDCHFWYRIRIDRRYAVSTGDMPPCSTTFPFFSHDSGERIVYCRIVCPSPVSRIFRNTILHLLLLRANRVSHTRNPICAKQMFKFSKTGEPNERTAAWTQTERTHTTQNKGQPPQSMPPRTAPRTTPRPARTAPKTTPPLLEPCEQQHGTFVTHNLRTGRMLH